MAEPDYKKNEQTPDEARKHDLKKIKANLRKIDKARVYRNIGSDAKKAVRKAEDLLNGRKTEGVYIIDKNGNEVYKDTKNRKKHSVSISVENWKDNILVHNHPFDTGRASKLTTRAGLGLSHADINNTIRNDARGIIAKSKDGYTYSMMRPHGGWTEKQKQAAANGTIARDWSKLHKKYFSEAFGYYSKSKTSEERNVRMARINSAVTARVNREIGKKYGLKIRRTMAASK
ncbi:MAG: hypothetical protein J6M59_10775 [Bacteroidaceae bacterium]|nr:hypothetical protein [Bacteroidaceae bacterium]